LLGEPRVISDFPTPRQVAARGGAVPPVKFGEELARRYVDTFVAVNQVTAVQTREDFAISAPTFRRQSPATFARNRLRRTAEMRRHSPAPYVKRRFVAHGVYAAASAKKAAAPYQVEALFPIRGGNHTALKGLALVLFFALVAEVKPKPAFFAPRLQLTRVNAGTAAEFDVVLGIFGAVVYLGALGAVAVTAFVETRHDFTLGAVTIRAGPLAPFAFNPAGFDAHLAGELGDGPGVSAVGDDVDLAFAAKLTASAY
jgi:hypothetical protein